MAEYEFTRKHIVEIGAEKDISNDEVIGWFPSSKHKDKLKAYSQKNIRERLKTEDDPEGETAGIQGKTATVILAILKKNHVIRQLEWLYGPDKALDHVDQPPEIGAYDVIFPSETSKEDIERLSREDSLTGFYRLTRRKLSDVELGKNFVVEYLDIYSLDDDIHFTLYAICNNYKKPITFKGSVRKLGELLILAGKRKRDEVSDLSFKMLFVNDEGGAHVEKSRVRWGLMTTKTLIGEYENPVSTRILLEKTNRERPHALPEPAFQDIKYVKETYLGSYSKDHPLYEAVIGLISNDIKRHAAEMYRPNIEAVPELALSTSQNTINHVTPLLIKNMGDLIEKQ